MAGPINLCGLEYLLLHAQERLPEQERAKHAGDIGDDDPLVGVDPVQARQRDVVGDQRELARDHHPGQHHHEDQIALGEIDPREGVGGKQGDQDFQPDADQSGDNAVDVELGEGRRFPGGDEIVPAQSFRKPDRREFVDLGTALQSGGHHPEEGHAHKD